MRKILLILISCTSFQFLLAQMNYSLTASTANFTTITNGTTPFFTGNGNDPLADEGYAIEVPIGFNFLFNSTNTYNKVSISTNGFISFSDLTSAYVVNNLTNGAVGERPIVAPLWDDLDLQTTTNISYITTGTAPNRIFTVQWLNAKWGFGAASAGVSFQVKLYETLNWIEFIYKQETGLASSPSASIGLTAIATGTNNFISIANFNTTPTVSTTSEVNTVATKPATNYSLTFKAGTLPSILGLFKVIKENNVHRVVWQTLQEVDVDGFYVEHSLDGTRFSNIGFVKSKAVNGNSNNIIDYSLANSIINKGNNYYRLKQVDKNGTAYFSSVFLVRNQDASFNVQLFPNPVRNILNIEFKEPLENTTILNIVSKEGKILISKKMNTQVQNSVVQLNVADFPSGIYTVQIINEQNKFSSTKTFIK